MKRHCIALIIRPYKNRLMTHEELRESINHFSEQLLSLATDHPNFHFNVALPGYILEHIDPMFLSRFREMQKKNALEWLLTGYSEPFLSFSPPWLGASNIRLGMELFKELTGVPPSGFVPPFSNWEPSYCTILRNLGLGYSVLSHTIWPPAVQHSCGYWFTEYGGDAIALFPGFVLHHYSAPADVVDWLEKIIARDATGVETEKMITVQYLLSLQAEGGIDPYRKLKYLVAELAKNILRFQSLLLQEARSMQPPLGLQYLPSSLPTGAVSEEPSFFHNRLHSYDQVGILQRKMLDVSDKIASMGNSRLAADLKRKLFMVQDINRFLPATASGFAVLPDRLWTYTGLIDLEQQCAIHEENTGGRIHITDYLRNGNKSIIMSNKALKVYCDYKNGGQIYELDYFDRKLNLCAAFNPVPHAPPDIVSPGTSCTAFIDRIYAEGTTASQLTGGTAPDIGDFSTEPFDYAIKKTTSSVKMALNRQGSFRQSDKTFPLNIEKVFGLGKDTSTLSFVYQAANHSLATFSFVFATEIHISLPGVVEHALRLIHDKHVLPGIGWEPVTLDQALQWSISDHAAGIRVQFVTQKPINVYCIPIKGSDGRPDPFCGLRILFSSPVTLDANSSWTLIGTINLRKIRERRKTADAV
ncbi:MAG: DUF1926 domain-containing protein [Chitinispirillaceae bacterium]|nr:DUF1926 domain-containing protein [Chitinispirillaceae bacterium]